MLVTIAVSTNIAQTHAVSLHPPASLTHPPMTVYPMFPNDEHRASHPPFYYPDRLSLGPHHASLVLARPDPRVQRGFHWGYAAA
ncbi:hypothetical protein PSPO01_05990 [Paraphaeosphaeria sporulosa]